MRSVRTCVFMASLTPLPLDELRDRVTKLEQKVSELRRQQPTVKGDRWRAVSLVIAGIAGLIVATPGAIETRWMSVQNEGADVVGLIGAGIAAWGVWQGRRVDQSEED